MRYRSKTHEEMIAKLDELIHTNEACKGIFGLGREVVRASFRDKKVVEDLETNMGLVHHNASAILNFLTREYAKTKEFSCRAGCSFCCHLRVAVSALEIFVLARFIGKSLDQAATENLKVKLKENIDKASEAPQEGYASLKMPCALLDSAGKCSVYEARPFSCRKWLSYDLNACEAAFKTPSGNGAIPLEAKIFITGIGIEDELLSQFEARGLNMNYYELQSGLLYALENEDAAAKWCRGEEVFRDCRLSN